MNHKRLAVATDVREGEMVALASTWELDKVGDRVMPGAYARTVAKIKAGERLPLIWGHDAHGSPTNWVGQIDDADETPEGLRIHAVFDLDDEAGRKAHRLASQGRVKSLSIGYAVRRQRKAADGANELLDIDLHEVSLVLTPANDGARILSVKSDDDDRDVPSLDDLRRREAELGLNEDETRRQALADEFRTMIQNAMGLTNGDESKSLRERAEKAAQKCGPITVTTFEC